uniref:Uncharacterized protein n=1 Tax=Helianthus annuus TaxID=4232 RepID=A0A251S2W1_HELAN
MRKNSFPSTHTIWTSRESLRVERKRERQDAVMTSGRPPGHDGAGEATVGAGAAGV